MTKLQHDFLQYLISSEPTERAKALLKRTFEQFVVDHGWWYEPAPLPPDVAFGSERECHGNAAKLASHEETLFYCEGYALFKSGMHPTLHAWVTDGQGHAFDNTWQQPGVAYAGVPFKSLFVTMTTLKTHAFVSLIDDYVNGWPLLKELGDRPDKWLEQRGRGIARLTEGSRE